MKAFRIALLVSLATCGLLLTLTQRAWGASPEPTQDTLGASVQTRVYVSDDRSLAFLNRSTVPATFTFEPSGGWSVEPASVTLEPGAQGSVRVSGDGDDGAKVAVNATMAGDVPEGAARTAIAFSATIYHDAPFDLARWAWRGLWAVAAALVVLRGLIAVRRLTRRYRIVRAAP